MFFSMNVPNTFNRLEQFNENLVAKTRVVYSASQYNPILCTIINLKILSSQQTFRPSERWFSGIISKCFSSMYFKPNMSAYWVCVQKLFYLRHRGLKIGPVGDFSTLTETVLFNCFQTFLVCLLFSGTAASCDCPSVLEATLKNFDKWLTESYIITTTKWKTPKHYVYNVECSV